jgi:hypothetical protein
MEAQVANMEAENKKLHRTIESLQLEKLRGNKGGGEFKYGALHL